MIVDKKKKVSIIGIIELFIIFFAFCVSTISYKSTLLVIMSVSLFAISALVYGVIFVWAMEVPAYFKQIHCINIIGGMLLGTLLLRDLQGEYILEYQKLYIVIFMVTLFVCEGLVIKKRDRKNKNLIIETLKETFQNNKGMCLILFLFVILSVYLGGTPYKWDSRLYYSTCRNLDMFSISNLAVYGHVAQGFGMIMKIATVLFGNVEVAAYIGNVILAMTSIIAFFKLIRFLCPSARMVEILLATGVYAFSPYILGLVNYLSLDYYCACVFPVLVYVTIREKWIYHLLCGVCFCFTKEPAIVIYCVFCFVWFLYHEFECWKVNKSISIRRILSTTKYWYMLTVVIMWLTVYMLLGPWSAGEGGFILDYFYVLDKLKVMYIMNFSWLFMLLCVCGIAMILWRKDKKQYLGVALIFIPLIIFTIFSCVFKTVTHYRYNSITFFSISIFAIVCVVTIKKVVVRNTFLVFLNVIVLLASYTSIDPISKYAFPNIYTGNGYMLSTSNEGVLGDSAIYNKQALWSENVFNAVIGDCIQDKDTIIVYSENIEPYYLDGLCDFGLDSSNVITLEMYWDLEKKQRTEYANVNTTPLVIHYIKDKTHLMELVHNLDKSRGYSCVAIGNGDTIAQEIVGNNYMLLEETRYNYFNWGMTRIQFSNEEHDKS